MSKVVPGSTQLVYEWRCGYRRQRDRGVLTAFERWSRSRDASAPSSSSRSCWRRIREGRHPPFTGNHHPLHQHHPEE